MATIVNDADVQLQATSPRLVAVTLPTNVIIGAIKGIQLTAPAYIFQVDSTGTASPTSTLLTATLTQVTGSISFGVIAGTASLTGVTSTTATLSYANLTTNTATIRASVTENSITYTSDVTIAKVVDGASSSTAYKTQSQSLAAPSVAPNPTTGNGTPPTGWSSTLTAPTAGNSLWAIDGQYIATTNQTTWSAPYLTQGIPTTIQSDNFVAGSAGWRIKRDTGDVEFGSGTFRGDVNTTGKGVFKGSSASGVGACSVDANSSGVADYGVIGQAGVAGAAGVYGSHGGVSGANGVMGDGKGSGAGVWGNAGTSGNTGAGVRGTTFLTTAPGMRAESATTANALEINGTIAFDAAGSTGTSLPTLASNKPGSTAGNFVWIPCKLNGVKGWIPWAAD